MIRDFNVKVGGYMYRHLQTCFKGLKIKILANDVNIFNIIHPSVNLFLICCYYTLTTALCLHNLQHVSTALHSHHQGVNCRQ
jgi:hypothetical protein